MKPKDYFKKKRKELRDFIPGKYEKVLEIGCGEGAFREHFNKQCEYWGVESNLEAGNIAKNKLNKIIIDDFFNIHKTIPNYYFDLIICNDIIEHLDDYNLFLSIIKNKMTKNAFIIGSIPNVRYVSNLYKLFFLKNWKYENEGILDNTHLRFFTKKSLIKTLSNNDFEILQLNGINGVNFSILSIKLIIKNLLILIFGPDSRYLQFAFSIKKINN